MCIRTIKNYLIARTSSWTKLARNHSFCPVRTCSPNFRVPAPMVCKGNLVANWELLRQRWEDYEIATGPDKRSSAVRLTSLRSVMGKDCLQTLLNLNISVDDRNSVQACMNALQNTFCFQYLGAKSRRISCQPRHLPSGARISLWMLSAYRWVNPDWSLILLTEEQKEDFLERKLLRWTKRLTLRIPTN